MLSESQSIRGGDAKTVSSLYDLAGNRTWVGYPGSPSSVTLSYAYDAINRNTQIRRGLPTESGREGEVDLVGYEYDGLDMTRRAIRTEYPERAGAVLRERPAGRLRPSV